MKRWIRVDDILSAKRTTWLIHGTGLLFLITSVAITEAFVALPIRQQAANVQKEIDQLNDIVAQADPVRDEFNERKARLEREKGRQQSFRQRVPDEPMEAAFLAQLAQLARSVELDVKHYRPGLTKRHAEYSELAVEMEVEGSHRAICRFLNEIPRLARISSFTGLEISSSPEQSKYPIRLNFSTYFVPMNTNGRPGTG